MTTTLDPTTDRTFWLDPSEMERVEAALVVFSRERLTDRYAYLSAQAQAGALWCNLNFEAALIDRLMTQQGFDCPTTLGDEPYPGDATAAHGTLLDLMEVVMHLSRAAEATRRNQPEAFTRAVRFALTGLTSLAADDPRERVSAAPLRRAVPFSQRQMALVKLMLAVTELAEAAEGALHDDPTNVAEELADTLIRCLHLGHSLGLNMSQALFAAMHKNAQRPPRHGKVSA